VKCKTSNAEEFTSIVVQLQIETEPKLKKISEKCNLGIMYNSPEVI